MTILYGFIGLIFFICLFNKAWKPAGILFIILVMLTPFYGSSKMKESAKNYKQAIVYFNNKDYQKAEELLNKVDEDDKDNYKLAEDKLKEIKNIKAEEEAKAEAKAKETQNNIDTKTAELNKTESKPKVILGSTRDEIGKMFSDYEIDKEYEKNVDANAIKYVNNDLSVIVFFDKNEKAEGVAYLANASGIGQDGKNSYVNLHYNELLKLATGGQNVKVERDAASKYPVELYIGNNHD